MNKYSVLSRPPAYSLLPPPTSLSSIERLPMNSSSLLTLGNSPHTRNYSSARASPFQLLEKEAIQIRKSQFSSKEPTISGLSLAENLKVNLYSGYLGKQFEAQNKLRKRRLVLPRDYEFDKLIHELDKITSKHKRVTLYEGLSKSFWVEEGKMQQFRVSWQWKKSPMTVKISRKEGTVVTYVSCTGSPTHNLYDSFYSQTSFEVYGPQPTLKHNYIYLGVLAKSGAVIQLRISFGKTSTELPTSRSSLPVDAPKPSNTQPSKRKRAIYLSDYGVPGRGPVKTAKSRTPSERAKKFAKDWESRRKDVLRRRDEFFNEKKVKHMRLLRKDEEIRDDKRRNEEIRAEWQRTGECQKVWIRNLYVLKALSILKSSIFEFRSHFTDKTLSSLSVKSMRYSEASDMINMARALANLQFYFAASNNYNRPHVETNLISLFKQLVSNAVLPICFKQFNLRIITIQKKWKFYMETSHERWQELVKSWNLTLGHIVKGYAETQRKRNTKQRKVVPYKYSMISTALRDKILREHMENKKQQYILSIYDYFESVKYLKCKILEAMRRAGDTKYVEQSFPVFEYLASEQEMAEMINQAANLESSPYNFALS